MAPKEPLYSIISCHSVALIMMVIWICILFFFFKAREALLCMCKRLFLIVSNALSFFLMYGDFKPPMASSLQSVVAEICVCVKMKKAMLDIYSNGTASP